NTPPHEGVNAYRHEWVSLRLFQAFVANATDEVWLKKIVETGGSNPSDWLLKLEKDGLDKKTTAPFEQLPPIASAIGWLVVSHHRLPNTYQPSIGIRAQDFLNYFLKIGPQHNQISTQALTAKEIE